MPRSSKQKLKLLYIRQLLLERSDEEHPVSVSDILAWLEENDIPAERKSIYADLDALRDYGMDILRRGGPGGGYFVGARDFELAELKLLVDAVETSKFITEAKTFALISKIEGLASESQARGLQRQVVVKNRIKTMDESIYYKVDELFDAISRDRAIRFRYYEYTVQKTRAFRHDGKIYEVSPYALTWDDEKYYLIAFDAAAGKIKHFRVDKLAEIDVTDEKRAGRAAFENLDLGAYATSHFGMFTGEERRVVLEFKNELVGAVLDRFGLDATIVPQDAAHFRLHASVAVSPQFFGWLCAYGDGARIISPPEIADSLRAYVAAIVAQYQ